MPAACPSDIPKSLWRRVCYLANSLYLIEDFGQFVDTHRDLPHIGSFSSDMHRGKCKIIPVSYDVDNDRFVDPESGLALQRHPKHMFVDPKWWTEYLVDALSTGVDPTDDKGQISTSILRDPRAKRYHLWSFRQVVMSKHPRP